MNIQDTEKLFILMKSHGIAYFKSIEVEIKMDGSVKDNSKELIVPNVPVDKPVENSSKTGASIPPVEVEIPHHVNEVANLLKLSDMDLVDKLFPDYTQPIEGQ